MSAEDRADDLSLTTSDVERAYVMRQADLDSEAGREPDPLRYAREFRNWIKTLKENL